MDPSPNDEVDARIKALTQLLEEQQRQREEADRRHEEAKRKHEEERLKRKEAEHAAVHALKQNLPDFLADCHTLSTAVRPVTEPSALTGGYVTNPAHRLYPQRILRWPEFIDRQTRIWHQLAESDSFFTNRLFPSSSNIDFVRAHIDPIQSEEDLRQYESQAVVGMVKFLFEETAKDHQLQRNLGIDGRVSFANHIQFGAAETTRSGSNRDRLGTSVSSGDDRPRNTRADQFCVYHDADGISRPLVAIEYKAPHKLDLAAITLGLQEDIWPDRDVIDKDDDDIQYHYKYLLAAVVTQNFSYMIDRGVQYGYICTGQAFIFMYIPTDPTTVYCSVNIPNKDYEVDNNIERTAVGQVFAFLLQALQDEQPDQAWCDTARQTLKRWKVEFLDVLSKIPETVRKSKDSSEYKPPGWKTPKSQPPRKRCRPNPEGHAVDRDRDSDSGDPSKDDGETTPTQNIKTRSRTAAAETEKRANSSGRKGNQRRHNDSAEQQVTGCAFQSDPSTTGFHHQHDNRKPHIKIRDRPYCSHSCLLGLMRGEAIDGSCPNASSHNSRHPPRDEFVKLVREQLASDRGQDADCCPLFKHGARGALLKIRLKGHGYTFVGKAVQKCNTKHLLQELYVYTRLAALQGVHIPVCIGETDLDLPYYYDGAELQHVLLLSWAGVSLAALELNIGKSDAQCEEWPDRIRTAYRAMHQAGVMHNDAELRNILYDQRTGKVMIIDFERSTIEARTTGASKPLGELCRNRKRRREHMVKPEQKQRSRLGGEETEKRYRKETENALIGVHRMLHWRHEFGA